MAVDEGIRLREVEVQALDAARLEPLIGPNRLARYEAIAEATQERLAGRAVLNVNSTATGGGVGLNIGPADTGNTARPAAGFTSKTNEM